MRQQKALQDAKKVRQPQRSGRRAGLFTCAAAGTADGQDSPHKRNRPQTKEIYQKALEEDASVFDYDGVYDEMKQNDKARPGSETW